MKPLLLKNHSLVNTPSIFSYNDLRETYLGLYNKNGTLYLITSEHFLSLSHTHDDESILSYTDVLMLFEVLLDYDYTELEKHNYDYVVDNLLRNTKNRITPAKFESYKTEMETHVYLVQGRANDFYYICYDDYRYGEFYHSDIVHTIKSDDPRVCAEKLKRILKWNNVFGEVVRVDTLTTLTKEQIGYIQTITGYHNGKFTFSS